MLFVFLSLVFTIHALVFLRQYLRDKKKVYYLLTSLGFVFLLAFYGHEAFVQLARSQMHHDWMYYIRISGIALCAVSVPILLRRLYSWVRSRLVQRSRA